MLPLVIIDDTLSPLDFHQTCLLTPGALPALYARLLAHTEHMTVTVEDFYQDTVTVTVLQSQSAEGFYQRKILLKKQRDGQVVQFGLVRIDLSCLPANIGQAIVEEKIPLGRVLIDHQILRRVEPTAFLQLTPGPNLMDWFGLSIPIPLYGRTGVIFCNDRPAIAMLEVLSPIG
jgi:chorismate-pyruvate lyase